VKKLKVNGGIQLSASSPESAMPKGKNPTQLDDALSWTKHDRMANNAS
jgi:hypothetical protein